MSLAQILAALRAAWWQIALMIVVAAGVAFAVASTLPKAYTAKARVLLNTDSGDADQIAVFGPAMLPGYVGTELSLVANEITTRDAVAKLGWPDNPQVVAAWQGATGGVGTVTDWAAGALAQNIHAAPVGDSAIIEIYYTSSSRDAAKGIVAVIRAAFIDANQRLRADSAGRASASSRTQATRALAELKAAEAARAKFVTDNDIAVDAPQGGLDYAAHMRAMKMAAPGAEPRVSVPVSLATMNLRRRLDAIDAELAVARLNGENNTRAVALASQRVLTAQQLARETAVAAAGSGASSAQIGLVRARLDADYLATRLNLLARSPLYDRLAAIDRDIALKTRHYNAAAEHVAAFAAVAAAPSGLRVLGDVIADAEPSYPDIPLMTGLAAATSFALGVALALVAEVRARRVRGAEDLTSAVAAPVLAVIAPAPPRRSRLRRRFSLAPQ